LSAGYTLLKERLQLKPDSNDLAAPDAAGFDPSHTWQLRSLLNIGPDGELDVTVRHASGLSKFSVPAYTALDVRLGWQLRRNIELSITGKNLFGSGHPEYGEMAYRSEIPASVFVALSLRQ
jgi:iron complex outermembrane receptor protein